MLGCYSYTIGCCWAFISVKWCKFVWLCGQNRVSVMCDEVTWMCKSDKRCGRVTWWRGNIIRQRECLVIH